MNSDISGALVLIAVGLGCVLGIWLGYHFHRANLDALTAENGQLKEALTDAYRAIADPDQNRARTAANIRRALREQPGREGA